MQMAWSKIGKPDTTFKPSCRLQFAHKLHSTQSNTAATADSV